MPRNKRSGSFTPWAQRPRKTPKLGHYIIVTDTACTEAYYFKGLRDCLPEGEKQHLIVKVIQEKTSQLVSAAIKAQSERFDPIVREVWIAFDRDQVPNFDGIIEQATKKDVGVAWSNPCIEIWFHAHFENMPAISESTACCRKFKELFQQKTGREYDKNDKAIFAVLQKEGDIDKAIKHARQRHKDHEQNGNKPSDSIPCSTVYMLVDEILSKINTK